jgi:pimeloyl-ACP methyl ester carboxylesterase
MKQKLFITLLLAISFSKIIAQKLPYPIIFIHGLNSNDKTWNDMKTALVNNYGLVNGGYLNVSLNFDNNLASSNKNVYPTAGADIAFYSDLSTISVGDFYCVNFDINNSGQLYPSENSNSFIDVLSNESAITKQGVALRYIIQLVLQKTNRDKVILFGHSMGGLCAREYLQNPINWTEPNVNHHIAKLITTGTPHKGSDAIGGQIVGVDLRSEAMRDLKSTYNNSGANGVYLFGGNELNSIMNDTSNNYYNIDVNCDGISNGGVIVGLNQKTPQYNLDYSCIIGTGALGLGDIAVNTDSANINNVYTNLTTNVFTTAVLHNFLPSQLYPNMKGLDEPNEYNIAYGIAYDIPYVGFITEQSSLSPYTIDYDDYKFNVTGNSQINLVVNNALPFPIYARFLNSTYTQVGATLTINSGNQFLSQNLSSGQYYLEIYGTPTSSSYQTPYAFGLTSTLSNENFISNNYFSVYPNPTNSKVNIKSDIKFDEVEIYDILGKKVLSSKISEIQEVDMSSLTAGVYMLKFSNNEKRQMVKVIKE